jgi:hypothetical protein
MLDKAPRTILPRQIRPLRDVYTPSAPE